MGVATLSRDQFGRFRDLLVEASGIEIPDSRRADFERAVLGTVEETGSPGVDALYRLLREDHPSGRRALEALAGKLTIGETHFFRNRPQFEALERQILPEIIGRRRGSRRLRLWSAGCSTGEEAYSLAILVKRSIPDLHDWHVTILATDIDRHALEEARQGLYRPWSFREVPDDIKAAWFTERKGRFELHPAIRDLVTFDYLNLVEDVYPSLHTNSHAMDLILCRNVLMYLHPQHARSVVTRLHDALSEGGWLVVGHTDPSQILFGEFEVRNLPGTVVYRKPDAADVVDHAPAWITQAAAEMAPPRLGVRPPTRRLASSRRRSPGRRDGVRDRVVARQEAMALLQRGRIEDARRRLEQVAAAVDGDAEVPYVLAKIAANRLELEVAERWIEVALGRSALHAPSHYLRGMLLQEDGRPEAALDSYRRCIYADPGFVLGHFALASLFARAGQAWRARKSLENVTRLLAGRERDELVADGDGMTVGRLLELTAVHVQFIDQDLGGHDG